MLKYRSGPAVRPGDYPPEVAEELRGMMHEGLRQLRVHLEAYEQGEPGKIRQGQLATIGKIFEVGRLVLGTMGQKAKQDAHAAVAACNGDGELLRQKARAVLAECEGALDLDAGDAHK
jgi:hypothetical protein